MIKLLNITKVRDDCYSVTIQDDACVIGQDEVGLDIYWTTSLTYNPANSKESLKARFEEIIGKRDVFAKVETDVAAIIKPTLEVIDAVAVVKIALEKIDISKIVEVK